MRILLAAVPLLLLTQASAQRLLHTHALPPGWIVAKMRSAGDADGDGHLDVAAITYDSPTGPLARLMVFSGLTGAPLYTVVDQALANSYDVLGIGDVNGDGRSDIVALANALRVYSGVNGALLHSSPPPSGVYASGAAVGDYDGNGTADVAVASYDNGATTVRIVRGENGAQLATLAVVPNPVVEVTIRAMGDLNGDGKSEVAIAIPSGQVAVLHGVTGATLWSIVPVGNDINRTVDSLDLDGDGRRELFLLRPSVSIAGANGLLTVHEPTNGALLFTVPGVPVGGLGRTVAGLGDLDQDGRTDFAMVSFLQGVASVRARSGANGRRLWVLPSWLSGNLGDPAVAVGDVDADGYGDFLVRSTNWPTSDDESVQLVAGRILAESQPQAGACGGGPFFPQLGATRPILGQTMTIAGQNGPVGAPGVLVFSLQPPAPVWLGASSCYAFFDLGSGLPLAALAQPQWSLALPLPLVPQLAGYDIALQSYFAPTTGPLGYDLGNGVWARLGYQ